MMLWKNLPWWRILRILVAGVVLLVLMGGTWFFPGYENVFVSQFGSSLLALTSAFSLGAFLAVAAVAAVTLLVGRLYCSILCPLGILQDLMMLFKGRFAFQGAYRRIKYPFFFLVLGLACAGLMLPLAFLMPSANFVAIENHVFREVCARVFYWLDLPIGEVTVHPVLGGFISAWAVFILLAILVRWRGRIYCNTLCPVGALLSLIAKFSYWKITLTDRCVRCGACERVCKSGCIDVKNRRVINENCVMCLNCIGKCKFSALKFEHRKPALENRVPVSGARREFLIAGGALVAGLAAGKAAHALGGRKISAEDYAPAMPPGAVSYDRFASHCVSCGLCIAACKGHVLAHATGQYGLRGFLQPYMRFSNGACEFNCNECIKVCPCGALDKLALDEKKHWRVGLARYVETRCISYIDGTDCGACAEHCPVGALEMVPYKETTIPKVHENLCIGCGACENICPARPVKAIRVNGVAKQHFVEKPVATKSAVLDSEEDFPF